MEHSILSPSSASRWIACPASAYESASMPPGESNYAADLGTFIHAVVSSPVGIKIPEWVKPEDYEAIDYCVEVFNSRVPPHAIRELRIESACVPDFGGTIDALVCDADTIEIFDLKTGFQKVDVEGNKQILAYLSLADERYPLRTIFRATIVQPRLDYVASATYTRNDIRNFREEVTQVSLNKSLKQVGSHCEYCPVLKTCDAAIQNAIFIQECDPMNLCDAIQIARFEKSFEKLVATAKETIGQEIRQGNDVEGFKIISKGAKREWADPKEAAAYFYGTKGAFCEPELRTVYQLEKAKIEVPAELVTKGANNEYVVPATAPGRPLSFGSEFDDS